MAVATTGSHENLELGYNPNNASVAKIGGSTMGLLQGDIVVEVPHERADVKAGLSIIKSEITRRGMNASFNTIEAVLENVQYAIDSDAPAGGVLTINEDTGSEVALTIETHPPNDDLTNDLRTVSMPKARANGPGTYTIPEAGSGESNQSIAQSFFALANTASNLLLGTMTDVYGV